MTAEQDGIEPEKAMQTRSYGGILVKFLAFAAVLIVAGGAAMWALMRSPRSTEPDIDVVKATTQSFEIAATAAGELRAKKQTVLRSDLEKETAIVEIVEEGTRVKLGDVLVRLNSDEAESELNDELLQLETARADVVAAESALSIQITENEASLRKATVDVELAEVDLKKFERGDFVEKQVELNLAVEKGNREVERLTKKVARSRELAQKQFLSQDELEKDELELIEAKAELEKGEVAKAAYHTYTAVKERQKLNSDLDQARSELDKTQRKNESELASKRADLANKKRQLELREDKVAKLKTQLEKSVIKAPTDGLVVYATSMEQNMWMNNNEPLAVGSVIHPNQEIIMLPDTSEMVAVVKIAESLVGRLKPESKAMVTIDAVQGAKFTGIVESIGIMAQSGGWRDPNVREYEVRIELDLSGQPHQLKPSMRCESRIVLNTVENVLAVPLQAVFSEGPHQFVYKLQNGRYHQTPVQVGRRSDILAEVRSGLESGAEVILREPPAARVVKAVFESDKDQSARGRPGGPGEKSAGGGRPVEASAAAAPVSAKTTPVSAPAEGEAAAPEKAAEPTADATEEDAEPDTEESPASEGDSAKEPEPTEDEAVRLHASHEGE